MIWQPIDTLPPRGHRPGRMFVVVQGIRWHSGVVWTRQCAGIAHTSGDGFAQDDISHIEENGDMDGGTGQVTHWMQWCLPAIPVAS
jgi:hypothetical protein